MNQALYLYAITEARPRYRVNQHGLEGGTPFCLECGELAAVVSPRDGDGPVPLNIDLALRHEAVVEELSRELATLPVRFGTLVRDEAVLADLLSSRADACKEALDRVRGHVELGLLALSGEEEPPTSQPPGSGREYLLGRLQEERRLDARRSRAQLEFATLFDVVRALAVDSTLRISPTRKLLLSAAFLVDRERVDAFAREVRRLQEEHGSLSFVCTGPWPAYSFVGEVLSAVTLGTEDEASRRPVRPRRPRLRSETSSKKADSYV
ncbi:MAG: GvpL/GvpF family gas vesicle protein [Thermoleophilia bacterium]|nr:GvpL/GvpF family gas vesicle protein [Thermoleophilia bacterium]